MTKAINAAAPNSVTTAAADNDRLMGLLHPIPERAFV
jgi:hypothetical protein